MLRIAISGATGRMGRALLGALQAVDQSSMRLTSAIHRPDGSHLGQDSGLVAGLAANHVLLRGELEPDSFDVLIDFTLPAQSMRSLEVCRESGKPMVIGTTGLDAEQQQTLESAARDIPIVFAANMSVGVNLCFYLVEQAARIMGPLADIEIHETHHRNKIDAPSGTALQMGKVVAAALDRDFDEVAEFGRERLSGRRKAETIGFASTRAGDVVGDHTVLFAAPGERIEITHKASDRQIYADGALRAAHWLGDKQIERAVGIYDMLDVLGLGKS